MPDLLSFSSVTFFLFPLLMPSFLSPLL